MEEKPKKNKTETIKSIGLVIAGLVGIIVGAHFTVYSSVELAYTIGIPKYSYNIRYRHWNISF